MIRLAIACALVASVVGMEMCMTSNYTMYFHYQKVSKQTNSGEGDGSGILVTGDGAVSLHEKCVYANEYWHLNATYLQNVAYYAWGSNSYLFNPLTGSCFTIGESSIMLKCLDTNSGINGQFGSTMAAILFGEENGAATQKTHSIVVGITDYPVITNMFSSITYQTDPSVTSENATNNITAMIFDNFKATPRSYCPPPPGQCLSARKHPDAAFHRGHFEHLVRHIAPGATLKHKLPVRTVKRDSMPSHNVRPRKAAPFEANLPPTEVCPQHAFTTMYVGGNEHAGAIGILRFQNENGVVNARFDEEITTVNGQRGNGTVYSLNGKQYWVQNGECNSIGVALPISCITGIRETRTVVVLEKSATLEQTYYMQQSTPEFSPNYALVTAFTEANIPLIFANFTTGMDNEQPYGKTSMVVNYFNFTNTVDSSYFHLPSICSGARPEVPHSTFWRSAMARALFRG